MAFAVSQFKSNIASNGGGARPNLFKVKIDNSVDGSLSFKSNETILVKSAQIPGSTIAALPINYVGRPIKYAGFRTFDNWTTTIINDDDFSMRNKVMEWMRTISGQLDGERNENYGAYATAAGRYFEGAPRVSAFPPESKFFSDLLLSSTRRPWRRARKSRRRSRKRAG